MFAFPITPYSYQTRTPTLTYTYSSKGGYGRVCARQRLGCAKINCPPHQNWVKKLDCKNHSTSTPYPRPSRNERGTLHRRSRQQPALCRWRTHRSWVCRVGCKRVKDFHRIGNFPARIHHTTLPPAKHAHFHTHTCTNTPPQARLYAAFE